MGLLIDLDVVAKPVDLHGLRWAHSLAREVEGTVLGDIQLLGLLNEVWEPCTATSREARDSESLATQLYQQPQTSGQGLCPPLATSPFPSKTPRFWRTAHTSWSLGLSFSQGTVLHLSGTSTLALLQLTFQLHQDRIRHHLHARDVEFADVGAIIRALGGNDAARENGDHVRALAGSLALRTAPTGGHGKTARLGMGVNQYQPPHSTHQAEAELAKPGFGG